RKRRSRHAARARASGRSYGRGLARSGAATRLAQGEEAQAEALRRRERALGPPQRLLPRKRRDHRPELGPSLPAGQREPERAQVAADCLQLADDALRVEAVLGELPEAQKS